MRTRVAQKLQMILPLTTKGFWGECDCRFRRRLNDPLCFCYFFAEEAEVRR